MNNKYDMNNYKLSNNDKNIIDNITNKDCFDMRSFKNYYSINGLNDIVNKIDYSYLVPNLFRLCYLSPSINIPNVCLTYTVNNIVIKFFPKILDEVYIKSFLYFNFPASYKDINYINYYINNIIHFKDLLLVKSRGTTYGSITPSNILYSILYNENSMLTQLLRLNTYLKYTETTYTNEKVICPDIIKWDYTTSCVKNNDGKTFFVGVYNNNDIINSTTAEVLNYLRGSNFNIFPPGDIINFNDILIVYKYNIFKILDYAQEVYIDILIKINYFLTGKDYCNKDYMNNNNIPVLFELYNNFYNNQIYTINNLVPASNAQDAVPVVITLTQYIEDFTTYYQSNNLGTVINTIYLNNYEGLIFCYNSNSALDPFTITRQDYQYFYINIYSPSPVELYNFWGSTGSTPDYTGSTVENFSNDFLYVGNGTTALPYLTTSGSVSAKLMSTYSNGGLYPLLTEPTSLALVYNTYNDLLQTKINSTVYLTFETELNNAVGLPLVYFKT